QERRLQFHTLRLNEWLDPFNPAVTQFCQQAKAFFIQQTGDPVTAGKMALQVLSDQLQQQAASLSYFDVFWSAAAISILLVALVLLMRRSVAEKGEHIGAE
ncbi:MAG TPA: hypothetical protein VHY37_09070, partial [Tepidisphaeraceae bacterium]|nr:hypothetical protein [Tepidisphaeraceae bacterium]